MFRIILFLLLAALVFLPLRWGANVSITPVADRAEPKTATILFAGDMMFDRHIRRVAEVATGDFIFSCIAHVLLGEPFIVGNLEGPITRHASVSVGSTVGTPENTRFTFPPETALLLARHAITVVSLGNNHILDFGWSGVEETIDFLDAAGVAHFGAPNRDGEESTVHQADIGEIPFTFIAYNQFAHDGWRAEARRAEGAIRTARLLGRLPIVFAHWGDEYVEANDHQKEMAQLFVSSGAAAVIGAHPHIIQERAFLVAEPHHSRAVPVYYSLGNFVFDQYFSDAVREGMLVRMTFSEEGFVSAEEILTQLTRDGRTCSTAFASANAVLAD